MGKRNQTIRNKRKIRVDNYNNTAVDISETNKIISKGFSREIKFTIISIFVVTIIMISSAFAIFSSINKSEESNTLTVGTLNVNFNNNDSGMGNTINLNGAYPETDNEGLKEEPYSFKITNSGNIDAGYKIKIVDDTDMIAEDGCGNNLLDKSNLRVSIDGKEAFNLSDTATNDYIVETGYLSAGRSKEYSVRMWLSDQSGNEVLGRHYHGKILIEAQNTSTLCSIISGSGTDIGDEITCGTESFNVVSSDGEKISMLAKYNLNVGDNKVVNSVEGIQDKDVLGLKTNLTTYGNSVFSTTNYWSYITDNSFILNENSNLYQYLNYYKNYLSNKAKVSDVEVSLLSKEQAELLGCNVANGNCISSPYSFLYTTSYWLGSSADQNSIYAIDSNGGYAAVSYSNGTDFGVRPLVTITTHAFK